MNPRFAISDPAGLGAALERVGDRWTLSVVGALLGGALRFGEVQQAVEGIATNVLTSRLRDLERQGLVVSRPYSERPLRNEYELTSAGADLAGVLKLLSAWGGAALQALEPASSDFGPPVHGVCGSPLEVHYWCPTCQQLGDDEPEIWA